MGEGAKAVGLLGSIYSFYVTFEGINIYIGMEGAALHRKYLSAPSVD